MKYIIFLLLSLAVLTTISCKKDEVASSNEANLGWIWADQDELQVINTPDFDRLLEIELPARIEGEYDVPGSVYFEVDQNQLEIFNTTQNSEYEILPASCYEIETKKVNLETSAEIISGLVKFSPKKVAALGGYHNEKYLLPIKIVSEDISVKENKEYFYFSFNLDSLIFEDNFDDVGHVPNPDYWSLCPRYWSDWNRYLSESYDQAYVENGNLVLKTEKVDDQYLTGGVETKDKFFFQHGKVSVRARFTKLVQGGWPAIWMMPQTPTYSGGWPNGGEIDIMEHLNKENVVHHAVHSYYSKNNDDSNEATSAFREGEYNVYEIEWNADEIKFYVNGIEGFKYKNADYANEEVAKQWPFNAPFYLILNNSLGGEGTWPGIINDAELPGIMEIDWVRITK